MSDYSEAMKVAQTALVDATCSTNVEWVKAYAALANSAALVATAAAQKEALAVAAGTIERANRLLDEDSERLGYR